MKYGLENKGVTECQTGTKVLDTSQCLSACKHLNIAEGNIALLQDGKPCFRGTKANKKQYCRQNDGLGVNAELICQGSGN